MNVDYTVDRIALHWMDKKKPFQQATQPVDLAAFKQEDRIAIKIFFSDHLRRVWDAVEGSNNISAATFAKDSEILQDYKELAESSDKELVPETDEELAQKNDEELAQKSDGELVPGRDKELTADSDKEVVPKSEKVLVPNSGQFLIHSQRMAQSLFDNAPLISSPGVLITLWFRKKGDQRQFLALFKMDPGRSNKIALRLQDQQGLLDLLVQHIDQALPDTGDRVLKWAVTPHPHPTRRYDVKIRDSQGKQKAIYFMKFLGCEAGKTEKEQIRDITKVLPDGAVSKLIKEIKPLPSLDLKAVRRSRVLTGPQIDKVHVEFPKGLNISSRALQTLKKTLKLNNGIIIRGPLDAMRSVKVTRLATNDFELVIKTTGYTESYD